MASEKSDPARKRGRPSNLNLDKILSAALEIGLGQVSMHKLARHLGVTPAALYRHIGSRDQLITHCTDLVSKRVILPETRDWEIFLYEIARAYRKAALSLPGSVDFIRYVGFFTPQAARICNAALGVLRDSGFSAEDAFMAYAGVVSHATDMVLHEELAAKKLKDADTEEIMDYSHLAGLANIAWAMDQGVGQDHEQNFETGLKIIVEGVKALRPANGQG